MILVTGGAGYIGSHTCVALAKAGMPYAILDNFSNSERDVPRRISAITGYAANVYEGDIRDTDFLRSVFKKKNIEGVVHLAGLKAVGESQQRPLEYFSANVFGSISVLQIMAEMQCRRFVFSSSATVYGEAAQVPIKEDAPCSATNPYGRSKLMVEEMLMDLERSDPSWRIARLRYFNPVGAHESGLIGESPVGTPNNLLPYVADVASGKRPFVAVLGGDYPTPDGTGVRDFVHVMDLAEGHVAALRRLAQHQGSLVVNLGTGRGTSVLEMISAFARASGRKIPYQIAERRQGDVPICYADVAKSAETLDWKATRDIDGMCRDAWRWQAARQ